MSGELAPPIADAPLSDSGKQHSPAWTAFNQAVVDRLRILQASMGVTDGSDATAGQIGEVISATVAGPGSGLSNNVPVNVATLPLTAGDWDVRGEAWFHLGSGPTGDVEAGISMVSGLMPVAPGTGSRTTQTFSHQASSGQVLPLTPCRFSLSAAATAYLVVVVGYSSGSAPTAYGRIEARRVR